MASPDIELMAHLMRRAGFGATYEELEEYTAKGYEATVDELLSPMDQPDLEMDLLERYFIDWKEMNALEINQAYLTYRMINTKRPLQEKMTLFWHGIFCVGNSKCEHGRQIQQQLDMFRDLGMGSFPKLLLALSVDPAMVFYLDNCMSHKDAINENFGRELLELFAMGVGMDGHANYSEEDVKACARAFTGWTIANAIPRYPYGRFQSQFAFNAADHDYGEKTFQGETGNFNGDDIIEIIVKQPSAARFIARHLYNFFVADEPQIPAWQGTPPRDSNAIKEMEDAYFESGYNLTAMLRVMFNSDWFKNARFEKVKSPAETVAGTMRLVKDFTSPKPGLHPIAMEIRYMGQDLMNPPTVEGWHTGQEWIDSGTLVERINFTADQMGNVDLPGVKAIIDRLSSEGIKQPEALLDRCLDMVGAYSLPDETRGYLVEHIGKAGELKPGTESYGGQIAQTLQLIVATQEYQFA
ncbi:MAG: DUF1800 domain-containing protein [Chloroflexi bacterium]|nr:DUF1800 domain-containing protein [Chloroflexota bacterium]